MAASDNYLNTEDQPSKVTYPSQDVAPGTTAATPSYPSQDAGGGAAIQWKPGQGVPSGLPSGDYQSWVNTAYQGSQGRAPDASEMQTWTDYWNQWGSKDPTYFQQRLFQPENYQGGGSPSGGGAAGAPYVPGQGVAGMGTVFGAGGATGTQAGNDYYQQLLGISTLPRDIDPHDPVVENQVQAFSADQTRANRDALSQAAEKGGPYGNTDAANRSLAETAGQKTAGYRAQLVGTMTAQRIAQIQSALQGQGAALSDSSRNQLQEELAQLQLSQGAYQFDSNMDYLNSPLNG